MSDELVRLCFKVYPMYDGWRLDRFIHARVPRLSRTRVQEMIHSQTALGGEPLRSSRRVREGEEILLLRLRPEEPPVPRRIDILFEDACLAAVAKPAGLPVHSTARYFKNTLAALLRERFPSARPSIAHRLDRETSGIVLVGLTREAAITLKAAFREHRVRKRYLALVAGRPPEEGLVDLPLGPDLESGIRIKMAVREDGLPSRTRFRTLESRGAFSLVEALPETGRQHQIRAHLAAIGHPLVGDKLYSGDPTLMLEFLETGWSESLASKLLLPRQALHAAGIAFPHPASGEGVSLECPLPEDLSEFWESLEAPA
jgi:23S rRNA pseudouridine1911/1915/1917 synthase